MEADRAGRVYQVSHVVDGEFANLLRRNHSDPYHFATGLRDPRGLTPIPSTAMMLKHFYECRAADFRPEENQETTKQKIRRLPFTVD